MSKIVDNPSDSYQIESLIDILFEEGRINKQEHATLKNALRRRIEAALDGAIDVD